jgi:CBS domain-containing protein
LWTVAIKKAGVAIMLIADLLKLNRRDTVTLLDTAKLSDAAEIMTRENIGAIVVVDRMGRLEGVLAEREFVAALTREGAAALRMPIGNCMRRNVPTVAPSPPVLDAMAIATKTRARHLPVIAEERVVGLLSVGDLLKSRLDEKIQENLVLMDVARWPMAASA